MRSGTWLMQLSSVPTTTAMIKARFWISGRLTMDMTDAGIKGRCVKSVMSV